MRSLKVGMAFLSALLAALALTFLGFGERWHALASALASATTGFLLVVLVVRSSLRGLRSDVGSLRTMARRSAEDQDTRWHSVAVRLDDAMSQLACLRDAVELSRRTIVEALEEAQHDREMVEMVSYRQLEALVGIYHQLKPRLSVPPLRGWAASPDLLSYVGDEVTARKPNLVVECGSGASTLGDCIRA